MGDINVLIPKEDKEIKTQVLTYWTKRADSFAETRLEEFHSAQAVYWRQEIEECLPIREGLKVLDVGCGSGFFEAILSGKGMEIMGIDLTPEMVEEGNRFLTENGIKPSLVVMDAENLTFSDDSFDAVISRNLTWTLPNPVKAYEEWFRVLKKGGVLLNFDAEYAKNFHALDQTQNLAHSELDHGLIEECHKIYHELQISRSDRPAWDREVLLQTGFSEVEIDTSLSDRIYRERNQFYVPDRMFRICARKNPFVFHK